MALTHADFTSHGQKVDAAAASTTRSFTLDSTPTSDDLVLVTIYLQAQANADPVIGTVTCCGVALTQIGTQTLFTANYGYGYLFRGRGAWSGTAFSIATTNNVITSSISVVSGANTDTSGSNGSGAIAQSKAGTVTTDAAPTVTLDGAVTDANGVFGGILLVDATQDVTAGTDFTLKGTGDLSMVSCLCVAEAGAASVVGTTVDASISASKKWMIWGVEVKEAGGAANTGSDLRTMPRGIGRGIARGLV
jgi:hypothetical protein